MEKNPLATVLMPVFNAEIYVGEAIESILKQTFKNFEFLIINDGSTDRTLKIIEGYKDARIRLVSNEVNLKLVKTLNRGIDLAKGKYIIRMDADDISSPDRIEKQINYMKNNPQVGIAGTWTQNFGKNRKINKFPSTNVDIKTEMLFKCAFSHPSVIMRKDLINKYKLRYDPQYLHCEDYALWLRSMEFFQMGNLEEILLKYRIGHENISKVYRKEQSRITKELYRENFKKLGIEDDFILKVIFNDIGADDDSLGKIFKLLNKVIEENTYYNDKILRMHFQKIWNRLCYKSYRNGVKSIEFYYKLNLDKNEKLSFLKKIKFFLRALMKI